MFGWIFSCHASAQGLGFRLFGRWTVCTVPLADIVGATVVTGLFNMAAPHRIGSHPFNTLRLGTRFATRWVLVEKERGWRFLAVTPEDPVGFAYRIGLWKAAAASAAGGTGAREHTAVFLATPLDRFREPR